MLISPDSSTYLEYIFTLPTELQNALQMQHFGLVLFFSLIPFTLEESLLHVLSILVRTLRKADLQHNAAYITNILRRNT